MKRKPKQEAGNGGEEDEEEEEEEEEEEDNGEEEISGESEEEDEFIEFKDEGSGDGEGGSEEEEEEEDEEEEDEEGEEEGEEEEGEEESELAVHFHEDRNPTKETKGTAFPIRFKGGSKQKKIEAAEEEVELIDGVPLEAQRALTQGIFKGYECPNFNVLKTIKSPFNRGI